MKNTFVRQPASALLTVILLMAAVGSIILLATKTSIDATRGVGQLDSASIALQMARSGIDEGLLRLQKDPASVTPKPLGTRGLSYAVYYTNGSPTDLYGTMDASRRLQDSPTIPCGSLESEIGVTANACPFYTLSIHSFVFAYNVSSANNNFNKYAIPDSDVPQTGAGTLTIQVVSTSASPTPTFSLVVKPGGADNSYAITQSGGTAGTDTLSQSHAVVISAGTTQIVITKGADVPGAVIGLSGITSAGSVQIQTSSTYIEATGYAGNVQRKLLLTIPREVLTGGKVPQKTLTNFAGLFDTYGFMQ